VTNAAVRGFVLCLAGWLAPLVLAGEDGLSNQLKDHPSPYLAMHGSDPVHWQLWSAATLRKAVAFNRPLFISSGYFSCHWCHVMQRESYQDPKLAALLNTYFVPVKIDRELNPALDAYLIEFVELTRGQAGWPLNVLLTPDGYPLLGATYLPPDQFYRLLDRLRRQWAQNEAGLRKMARDALQEWRQAGAVVAETAPSAGSLVTKLLAETRQLADELAGGFGQQAKFPMVSQLRALLYLRRQGKAGELDDFIRLTLDRMAGQGMHDNLGGGFFRYVTDPAWQTPHYEKMLYDNAQLAILYLEAADLYQSARYRAVGLDTVNFMLQEMLTDEGAFIGSFSAVDSRGREGFYYLWPDAELSQPLTATEFQAVQVAWVGEHHPDSEYGHLLRWQAEPQTLATKLGWPREKLDRMLAAARRKLLAARARRELLADTKVLAAWNGLALSALARAYVASGDKTYALAARRLASYLTTRLWNGRQLLRARDGEQTLAEAVLEDYALVAQGLWDWNRVAPQASPLVRVLVPKLVRLAWQRYFKDGRWQQSDAPLIPMLNGKLALDDGPLPSASAVLSHLSMETPDLTSDMAIQEQLMRHLQQVRGGLSDAIFWYASYVELLADNRSAVAHPRAVSQRQSDFFSRQLFGKVSTGDFRSIDAGALEVRL
jgi:uncharacterized protein YyaL (SSP411 family)